MHRFYGQDRADDVRTLPGSSGKLRINTLSDMFVALCGCWSADTCAPRLRDRWSGTDLTVGQCSVTAFLIQDMFGGQVRGLRTPFGIHCYNVIDGQVFDLTNEQFGSDARNLKYDMECDEMQDRDSAMHFGKTEKRERYELLKSFFF